MTNDPIEDLLRADEEALKAKRGRLRAFAKATEAAREAVKSAQKTGEAALAEDGLTRADLAAMFGLTAPEKRLLLPTRSRSEAGGEAVSRPVPSLDAESDDPEQEAEQPRGDKDREQHGPADHEDAEAQDQ